MSQVDLASQAGFKHQSAIGNLETRATGRGGYRLAKIAEVLEVPIEWLLNGPDTGTIPHHTAGRPAEDPRPRHEPAELSRAIGLLRQLNAAQLAEATAFLEFLVSKKKARSNSSAGRAVPAPSKRAA